MYANQRNQLILSTNTLLKEEVGYFFVFFLLLDLLRKVRGHGVLYLYDYQQQQF